MTSVCWHTERMSSENRCACNLPKAVTLSRKCVDDVSGHDHLRVKGPFLSFVKLHKPLSSDSTKERRGSSK